MTPLWKWLGVCVVAAGLTFIAFASAARLLPLRLESAPKVGVQDYVNTRVQVRPKSYRDIAADMCHYPVNEAPPPFPNLTPNQPRFPELTKMNFTVTIHDPGNHGRRIPPIMPSTATKSGHCKVEFDVDEDGNTFNIKATFCSEDLFAPASIKSVRQWQYSPRIKNGNSVVRKGVETKITYILQDEDGNILPE